MTLFQNHVSEKGLKRSVKRDRILHAFLKAKRHLSVQDLSDLVQSKYPEIGYTTVYRAMKLIVSSGLAEKVDFDDGVKRFERKVGREYHSHFICTSCGHHFEVFDKSIERLSQKLCKENTFQPQKHRLEIFGLCKRCH